MLQIMKNNYTNFEGEIFSYFVSHFAQKLCFKTLKPRALESNTCSIFGIQ